MNLLHNIFTTVLYQPLFNALIFLAYIIPGHSIGWAIILLTIVIRLALYPTSTKTLEHQARLRTIQPKLDALKEKHGSNRDAHSKAIMELYAAEKVSPFGSCLPLLIQLVVFGVLYRVFIHGLSTDGFNLLYKFTPHLTTINTHWFGLDLTKPEKFVIPLLAAAFQYIATRQMMSLTPTPAKSTGKDNQPDFSQTMAKQMTFLGPVMTYLIAFRLPAALGLYWTVTTIFMAAQQWWYLRQPMPELSNTLVTKDKVTVTIRNKGDADKGGSDDA